MDSGQFHDGHIQRTSIFRQVGHPTGLKHGSHSRAVTTRPERVESQEPFHRVERPDLTLKGVEEARAAGRCLKAHGYFFNRAFTSNLVRAQHTLQLVLAELGTPYMEVST